VANFEFGKNSGSKPFVGVCSGNSKKGNIEALPSTSNQQSATSSLSTSMLKSAYLQPLPVSDANSIYKAIQCHKSFDVLRKSNYDEESRK